MGITTLTQHAKSVLTIHKPAQKPRSRVWLTTPSQGPRLVVFHPWYMPPWSQGGKEGTGAKVPVMEASTLEVTSVFSTHMLLVKPSPMTKPSDTHEVKKDSALLGESGRQF